MEKLKSNVGYLIVIPTGDTLSRRGYDAIQI